MIDQEKYEIIDGLYTLVFAGSGEDVSSFDISEGTQSLSVDAFAQVPGITEISVPASLKNIPDGALSNGGDWASGQSGIRKIRLSPNNSSFEILGRCFCGIKEDGTYHLIRVIGEGESVDIPMDVTSVGRDAFKGVTVSEVYIEPYGFKVCFPATHRYFLSVLLENFGRFDRIYYFFPYDEFLLRKHFNEERIRMIRSRLEHPYDMAPEMNKRLKDHVHDSCAEICEFLTSNGSMESIEDLIAIGFFDRQNTDAVIEALNREGKTELKMRLINYKNSNLGFVPQDFEI